MIKEPSLRPRLERQVSVIPILPDRLLGLWATPVYVAPGGRDEVLDVGPHAVTLNKQGLLFVYGSTTFAGGTLIGHATTSLLTESLESFGLFP